MAQNRVYLLKYSLIFNSFILRLENVAILGGWSEVQRLIVGRIRCKGYAESFLNANPNLWETENYAEFKNAMINRFKIDDGPAQAITNYMECRQRQNENVAEYCTRLRGLAQKTLKITGDQAEDEVRKRVLDEGVLTNFIVGLRDPVRGFAMSKEPQNIDDALKCAISEEQNERMAHGRRFAINQLATSSDSKFNIKQFPSKSYNNSEKFKNGD
jgi:hypothetical protein